MIVGTITNSERVEGAHPLFKKVFAFLREHELAALPLGRTDIEGERAYVKVEDVRGRSREQAVYERHERYVDIQLPMTGRESYGWKSFGRLGVEKIPYDKEKDIAFYEDEVERVFTLEPGDFAVFFPEDGHAPCIDCGTLRKAVVKVLIEP